MAVPGVGSSVSMMVRVNVCMHGHRVFDVDCGSCRRLNPDPTPRPRGLRRRHLAVVAVRDSYGCRLCGDLVDMALPVGHCRAATLDHAIPRARGGSDHRDNLQLAHRDCNQAKADDASNCRGIPELPDQMPSGLKVGIVRGCRGR